MKNKKCRFGQLAAQCDTHKRGSSSFCMHNTEQLFAAFALKTGDVVLDLGCGPGDYAFACSERIGEIGVVYAMERDPDLIKDLQERAKRMGVRNIRPINGDITQPLPLADCSVDVCIIVTVLHHPAVSSHKEALFTEVHRILKPSGRFFTIDVNSQDASFGPPLHMRISHAELERIAAGQGFALNTHLDLGRTYLLEFHSLKALGNSSDYSGSRQDRLKM